MSDYQNERYIYQYKDHLGNVRINYTKLPDGSATVLDGNQYYPFGMNHLNASNDSVYDPLGAPYNYKYNGKELQESGMYDYGWRHYMPDIARWNGMDQLSEKFHNASPYAYVMNNPAILFDPDGRDTKDWLDNLFKNSQNGYNTTWLNTGNGFTNNWGGHMSYDGSPTNFNWGTSMSSNMGGAYSFGGGYINIPGITLTRGKQVQSHFNSFMDGFNQNFTNLSNNQCFSAGHLIASESVARFGSYSLNKALKPDYSVNFTVLDDVAKPYRITTIAGIKVKPATAATLSKVSKYGGVALAVISVGATELQYADGQIGDTERIMNHMMTGVGMIPTPWTIGAGLVYGVVTGGYQAATGRSIFNDMGLGSQ